MRWSTLWRRGRREPAVLPPTWRPLLADGVAAWRELDDDERARLEELTAQFAADKHWEAARGFRLTDEVRAVVSAQAGLLVLGLGLDWLDHVHTVIVHRSAQTQRGERHVGATAGLRTDTPRRIHGRTGAGRPVVVAWDAARRESRNPARGRNVVLHELAHQLDVRSDRTLDGTPDVAPELRARWIEVSTAEYEAVRAGGASVLRSYAGDSPAEFFAVATEAFLCRPTDLEDQHRDLYEVLRSFYRQDPAGRRRRATSNDGGGGLSASGT